MNNDKLKRLEIYAKHLLDRLSSPVPTKHQRRQEAFKEYLTWELSATQKKIESLKLTVTKS